MSDKQIGQIAFLKTWRDVQRRIKTRPPAAEWCQSTKGGKINYLRRGRKQVTKEYKCILHFESERKETPYPSMAEAVFAMQNALVGEKRIVFAEVICVTTERVAYQSRLLK
jgi:hypothetical protein